MEELKPCPLCGCDDYIIHVERYEPSYIKCNGGSNLGPCHMQVRSEVCGCTDASPINTLNSLIRNWNQRIEKV